MSEEFVENQFELEETLLKIQICDAIFDQLMNENVEILEHVNLSRKNSHLYGNKSIYACENIPRLDFQIYEDSIEEF